RPHIGSCKTQHEETESQKGPHDPIPGIPRILSSILENGGMGERLKPAVLKTAVRGTVPGVRIPLPPFVSGVYGQVSRAGVRANSRLCSNCACYPYPRVHRLLLNFVI